MNDVQVKAGDDRTVERGSAEKRSISQFPEDWLEVDVLARTMGIGVSAALRQMIREWRDMRDPAAARRRERLAALARGYRQGQVTATEFADEAARLVLNGEATQSRK